MRRSRRGARAQIPGQEKPDQDRGGERPKPLVDRARGARGESGGQHLTRGLQQNYFASGAAAARALLRFKFSSDDRPVSGLEQFRFHKRFAAKNRVALICAGVAPGLTNILAQRGSELLDSVESVQIRLFESTESKDPISTWSADVAYDEAISRPPVYRNGRFLLAKRFDGREKFRFPPPIGETPVYLAAQDEVCLLPYVMTVRDVDARIGGNDFERLRRWYRQGRLNRSAGIVRKRFPQTLTPRRVAKLIRSGVLENARFAAAVLVRGTKDEQPLLVRWDAAFPSLYQIRQRGLISTPIAYATAHLAAIFIKRFPREMAGVIGPGSLSAETRRAVLADARARGFRITLKMTRLRNEEREEDDL